MTCPRCGNANSVFETRCTRCGAPFGGGNHRALGRTRTEQSAGHVEASVTGVLPPGGARPFLINPQVRFSAVISNAVVAPAVTQAGADHPNGLVSTGSTARRLDLQDTRLSRPASKKSPQPAERPQLRIAPPSAQPSLFQPGDLLVAPASAQLQPVTVKHGDGPLPRRKPARKRAKTDLLPFAQGTLDFLTPTAPPARQLRTKVAATILCDQRCASPMHRFAATLVDTAYTVLITAAICGLFLGALHQWEIALPANSRTLYWGLGSVWLLVTLIYQTLFTHLGLESPGYRSVGLQVMNFDGSMPSQRQRWQRLLASFISLAAGGLGIAWALFEEEHLTWHDNISGTFAAPKSSIVGSFHRG